MVDPLDAIRYEISGDFDKLTSKISEFLSGLYQWKLSLSPNAGSGFVTGKHLDVRGFQVVTGRNLRD